MYKKLMSKNYHPITPDKGLSFVEVIVWVGVLTLLMAAMTVGIINVYRSNSYTLERAIAVISVRRGLESVTRLVREASYSNSGGYPVVALGSNSFTFYADYDNDGSVEKVRMFLDGEDLKRGIVEPVGEPAVYTGSEAVGVIVSNLRNIVLGRDMFTYYNRAGAKVVNMSLVLEPVFVSIDLVANTGRNPTVNDHELHGSAFMRNLKN